MSQRDEMDKHDSRCPMHNGSNDGCVCGWMPKLRGVEDAIERVRDLHRPSDDNVPGCMGCGVIDDDWNENWPCPTIRALDGEQA